MRIARIKDGVVVNIEVASQAWLDAHADDPDFLFVTYTPAAPAGIGDLWDGTEFVTPDPPA